MIDYFKILQRFAKIHNLEISWTKCYHNDKYWQLQIIDSISQSVFDIRKNNLFGEYIDITYILSQKSLEQCCKDLIQVSLGNYWECMKMKKYKIFWPKSIEELNLKLDIIGV